MATSDTNRAKTIYKTNTKSFVLPGGDGILRKKDGILFSSRFDEPTYLTFRVEFDFDNDMDIAKVPMSPQLYDEMPHPLFNVIYHDVYADQPEANNSKPDRDLASSLNFEHIFNNTKYAKAPETMQYSAYNYLKFSLGEDKRAYMLLQLKTALKDLQENFPHYIKSIEGLGNLLKVDPKKGIRIPDENSIITLKCDEGLDLKITHILTLYRKIVWDDVYQRWILPDMMRFFKMRVYISELRVFHEYKKAEPTYINDYEVSNTDLVASVLNELMPTICIECSQCTFDMSDTMSYIGTLSSSKNNNTSPEPNIKIKVGNIKEIHDYKLNRQVFDKTSDEDKSKVGRERFSYSDFDLQRPSYGDRDTFSNEAKEISISNPLERAGIDYMTNGTYSKKDSIEDFEIVSKELAQVLSGMIATNAMEIYENERSLVISSATNYRNIGPIAHIIEDLFKAGAGLATNYAYSEMAKFMAVPVGSGWTVGDIWTSLTSGDLGSTLNKLLRGLYGNPAVRDYVDETVRNSDGAIKEVDLYNDFVRISLEGIVTKSATNNDTPLVKFANSLLSVSSIATTATAIASVYDSSLFGTSNEVVDDTDSGYTDPGLVNPPYTSTADDNDPTAIGLTSFTGTSNEVIDDLDSGYAAPAITNPPYTSTADDTDPLPIGITTYTGTSNEAIDDKDNGYINHGLTNPPYTSTADDNDPTAIGLTSFTGTSNEVIDDLDSGYADPGLVNPPYTSTADDNDPTDIGLSYLSGTSNEAIDDLDNGYSDTCIDNPEYTSEATDKTIENIYNESGTSNEAIDDLDNGYSDIGIRNPLYRSTADILPIIPSMYQIYRGVSNEAINDFDMGYHDPMLKNPPYQSTADKKDPLPVGITDKRGLSNEVVDDLDNGYSAPKYPNNGVSSQATSGRKIEWKGITLNVK